MNREYREDGRNRFFRLETDVKTEKGYTYRMVFGNRIPGLLSFQAIREEDRMYYEYLVTGLRPLTEWVTKETETGSIYSLLTAISRLGEVVRDYMLSPDELVLDPECIFVKPETGQYRFCYSPGKKTDYRLSLQAVAEFLMKTTEPTEEADILRLYGLYQKAREPETDLSSLLAYWQEMEDRAEEAPQEGVVEDMLTDYSEIGIEKKTVRSHFSSWQKKKTRMESQAESLAVSAGEDSTVKKLLQDEHNIGYSEEDSEAEEDDYPDFIGEEVELGISSGGGGGLFEKGYRFMKHHLVEISLGCGAAAAAIAIVLAV